VLTTFEPPTCGLARRGGGGVYGGMLLGLGLGFTYDTTLGLGFTSGMALGGLGLPVARHWGPQVWQDSSGQSRCCTGCLGQRMHNPLFGLGTPVGTRWGASADNKLPTCGDTSLKTGGMAIGASGGVDSTLWMGARLGVITGTHSDASAENAPGV
jgi:hypothetical protein